MRDFGRKLSGMGFFSQFANQPEKPILAYMKYTKVFSILIIIVGLFPSNVNGEHNKLTIVQPKNNEVLHSPVKICMEIEGLILEPAKNGVREGYGHHHVLFSSLPTKLTIPIGKNEAIHISDGTKCTTVDLVPGQHVIRSLFANGDHVPYNPPVTDKVLITVE